MLHHLACLPASVKQVELPQGQVGIIWGPCGPALHRSDARLKQQTCPAAWQGCQRAGWVIWQRCGALQTPHRRSARSDRSRDNAKVSSGTDGAQEPAPGAGSTFGLVAPGARWCGQHVRQQQLPRRQMLTEWLPHPLTAQLRCGSPAAEAALAELGS